MYLFQHVAVGMEKAHVKYILQINERSKYICTNQTSPWSARLLHVTADIQQDSLKTHLSLMHTDSVGSSRSKQFGSHTSQN